MVQMPLHVISLSTKVNWSEDYKISVQELAADVVKEGWLDSGDEVGVLRGVAIESEMRKIIMKFGSCDWIGLIQRGSYSDTM